MIFLINLLVSDLQTSMWSILSGLQNLSGLVYSQTISLYEYHIKSNVSTEVYDFLGAKLYFLSNCGTAPAHL